MNASNQKPVVAIVMCTYNGSKHLCAQLDSFLAQDWPIALYVFDDASTDNTVDQLKAYTNKLDITVTVNEHNLGYVANFEAGVAKVLDDGFDYIALSDQDDVWDSTRISAGIQRVQMRESSVGKATAILAHSDLTMIDADDKVVHESFFKYRRYAISNTKSLPTILGQNGVMGNTILMNKALATLALPFPKQLHVHDYWIAVIAELYGSRELIERSLVGYRIHDDNASNSSDSIKFGTEKLLDGKSWRGFVSRDYRLPFKEDSRMHAISTLLDSPTHLSELNAKQHQLLQVFYDYLAFKRSRVTLLYSMMKFGFFRTDIKHRLRLIYSVLLTNRYNNP